MTHSALHEHSSELQGPVVLDDKSSCDVTDQVLILAISLGLCPKPEDLKDSNTVGDKVPASLAIIEAGATQTSKTARRAVEAVGGFAVLAGVVTSFWQNLSNSVRATTVASAAFVLAAALVAMAMVVSSDVRARGVGSAAQYAARSQVVDAYLRARAVTAEQTPKPVLDVAAGNGTTNGSVPTDAVAQLAVRFQ